MNDTFFFSAPQLKRDPLGRNVTTSRMPASRSVALPAELALLWVILATGVGLVLWCTLAATVPPLVTGDSPRQVWQAFATRFVGNGIFGSVVALLLLPIHWLLVFGWVAVVRRKPALDATHKGATLSAFILALPVTLVVAFSYSVPETFPWTPIVLASAWAGVLLPRIGLRHLRPGSFSVAA